MHSLNHSVTASEAAQKSLGCFSKLWRSSEVRETMYRFADIAYILPEIYLPVSVKMYLTDY
ncbi:hypothetical protein [uncultured Nostoc sp.]|uniref:hypothetical protein n=1 Tax=uncultured Nostoc sp. TaxID=340711 RepID=UPI0035CB34A0